MKKLATLGLSCVFLFSSVYVSASTPDDPVNEAITVLGQWISYDLKTQEDPHSPTNQQFANQFSDDIKDMNAKQIKTVITKGIQASIGNLSADDIAKLLENLAKFGLAYLKQYVTPIEKQYITHAFKAMKASAQQMNQDETTSGTPSLTYSNNIKESVLFGLIIIGAGMASPNYDFFGYIEGLIEKPIAALIAAALGNSPVAGEGAVVALQLIAVGISFGVAAAVDAEASSLEKVYIKGSGDLTITNPCDQDANSHECHCEKEPNATDCPAGDQGDDGQSGQPGSDKKKSNSGMIATLGLLASGGVAAYEMKNKEESNSTNDGQ